MLLEPATPASPEVPEEPPDPDVALTLLEPALPASPDVPDDAEYCIFAGQNACADDALEYYKEYFKHETGKELTIFFVNPQRKRSSVRAIYKAEYRDLFNIDNGVYNSFIEWLQV